MAHVSLQVIRRRLFTIVSAISLTVCLTMAALWISSYWRGFTVGIYGIKRPEQRRTSYYAASYWGRIRLSSYTSTEAIYRRAVAEGSRLTGFFAKCWDEPRQIVDMELETRSYTPVPGTSSLACRIPHWSIVLATSVLPAISLIRWRRRRAQDRLGLCPVCGYDLRATPDRCPECGTAVSPRAAAEPV